MQCCVMSATAMHPRSEQDKVMNNEIKQLSSKLGVQIHTSSQHDYRVHDSMCALKLLADWSSEHDLNLDDCYCLTCAQGC